MIKKLFLCAALIGAVGLTSCVDDVESASTQAVRQAKAAQLKAKGDLEKANAQAELILKNADQQAAEATLAAKQAEAEYNKAQAAYELAKAAYEQARADAEKALTEKEKAEAAIKLEEAKVQLEMDQIELERRKIELQDKQSKIAMLIAQYEKDLAEAEYNAELYRQQLQEAINKAKAEEYTKLQGLVGEYNTQYSQLTELKKALNDVKLTLAKYEAGMLDEAGVAKSEISRLEKENNGYKKNISDAKAQIEALQTSDVQTAVAKYETLKAEQPGLNQAWTEAQQAQTEAQFANSDAKAALNNSNYMTAINALKSSTYRFFTSFDLYTTISYSITNDPTTPDGELVPSDLKGYWYVRYSEDDSNGNPIYKYIRLFSDGSATTETYSISYTYWTWSKTAAEFYTEYSNPYFKADASGCDTFAKLLDAAVKPYENEKIAKSKELDKYVKLQAPLLEAEKKYEAAKNANTNLPTNDPNATALSNAQKNAGKKLLEAINNVRVEQGLDKVTIDFESDTYYVQLDNKSSLYTPAQNYIDREVKDATNAYNRAENNLNSTKQSVDEIQANLTTISTGSDDFAKLVANAGKASKDYAVAKCESDVALGKLKTNQALMYAYNVAVMDGANASQVADMIKSLNQVIASKESLIEQNKTMIAKYQKDIEAGTLDNEKIIAQTKAEIEKLEGEIAYKQQLVDAAKAALDAALAEDAPAE